MIFYNGFNLLLDIVFVYIAYRIGKGVGYRAGYKENEPPFQEGAHRPGYLNYDTIDLFPINVVGVMYNNPMKKTKKPMSKTNNAIRKAHSAELFRSLMLSPHLVATPETRKGSRQSNKRKAIAEYL